MCVFAVVLTGCYAQHAKETPPAPSFAPIHTANQSASTQASETANKTGKVVAALNAHVTDTRPASGLVAEVLPLAREADDSANRTIGKIAAVEREVLPVEKAVEELHGVAVENEKAATHFEAKYTAEKESWFGGKLGRILWWVMWIVGGIGLLFIVSQVLLSTVAPTGWINFLAIPIHIIGNLVRAGYAGLKWCIDEIALWHIPWGQSVLPTKPPVPTNPITAPTTYYVSPSTLSYTTPVAVGTLTLLLSLS
jgi:hypothetical protein